MCSSSEEQYQDMITTLGTIYDYIDDLKEELPSEHYNSRLNGLTDILDGIITDLDDEFKHIKKNKI